MQGVARNGLTLMRKERALVTEDRFDAVDSCARCGDDCSMLPHISATTCSSFECNITSCQTGWGSCDDDASNGCETNLFSAASCGGCAGTAQYQPCTNLPNVAVSSCGAGSCVIDSCSPGWVSCDGNVANGCEQSLSTVGPCFPDTQCVKHVFLDHDYFMCTNDRTWPGAIDKCNDLVGGTLVRIDSMAENDFVRGLVTGPTWIGERPARPRRLELDRRPGQSDPVLDGWRRRRAAAGDVRELAGHRRAQRHR